MKTVIVLFFISIFLVTAYIFNGKAQKMIRPRTSFSRLLLYFIIVFIAIFLLGFLMVFIITKIYPDELIK